MYNFTQIVYNFTQVVYFFTQQLVGSYVSQCCVNFLNSGLTVHINVFIHLLHGCIYKVPRGLNVSKYQAVLNTEQFTTQTSSGTALILKYKVTSYT